MLFPTHILLGIILFLSVKDFFIGGNVIIFFLLVLLGSILPDLDEPQSKINQWTGIFGKIITFFFKHRGVLHSLWMHIILFFVMWHYFSLYYAKALFLGYIAHIIGDMITPRGVQLWWPFSEWKIKGPVKVGGFFEWILFGIFFLLIMREIWMII